MKSKPHKKNHWRLTLLAAVLLAGAVFAGTGLTGTQSPQEADTTAERRVLVVRTIDAVLADSYERKRTFLGEVESQRRSQIGFEVAGKINKLYFDEGQLVEQGQLIGELDVDRLEAAKAEAEAFLAEAEASYELATTTLKRTERAKSLNAISAQQLDEAKQTVERQVALVNRAKAQIERIEVDIEKSSLYAPYSGSIAIRFFDEGTVVNAGQPVVEVMETANPDIRIGIDRIVSKSLRQGDALDAYSQGIHFQAEVNRILPGRDRSTRSVQVIASVLNQEVTLREGDLVEIAFSETVNSEGIWLPVTALTESKRGLWSAYVGEPIDGEEAAQGATHRLTRKEIEIESLQGNLAFVSGGIVNGDAVVTEGIHRIVPGQQVRTQTGSLSTVLPNSTSVAHN